MSGQAVISAVSKVPAGPATSACVQCNPVSAMAPAKNTLASVPPKEKPPIPCKILTAQITDPQGRKPNAQGLLYVVPPAGSFSQKAGIKYASVSASGGSAATENLTCVATIQGGCGKHLEWEIATSEETYIKVAGSLERAVPVPKPEEGTIPKNFPFSRSRIRCVACEGGAREFTVLAVSGDQVEFEFKVDEIAAPFNNVLRRVANFDGKIDKKPKKETAAKLGIKQGWEEEKGTHRAYCTTEFDVSADPVFALEGKFLCYGVKLPKVGGFKIEAGLFVSPSLTVKLNSNLTIRKWAGESEWKYESGSLTGNATGTIKLSGEATFIDEEVAHAEIAGITEAEGSIGLHSDAKFVRVEGKWKPLTVMIELKAWDGWIEHSAKYQCFDEMKDHKDLSIDSLFGKAKA